jgi:hypothetical protein
MGFRTVVMLSNDTAYLWQKDAELGDKIALAMNYAGDPKRQDMATIGSYGRAVECTHADCQTLAVLDGYAGFNHVVSDIWARGDEPDATVLRLLKQAAKKLGYRLVKQPAANP